MNARLTTQQLDSMAWTIDRDGIEAIPTAALRELGFEARSAGVRPSLADLLVDPAAPSVVRNRVFGLIAGALQRRRPSHDEIVISPEQVTCAA